MATSSRSSKDADSNQRKVHPADTEAPPIGDQGLEPDFPPGSGRTPGTIPILKDDMAAVPVLTEVLDVPPAPANRPRDGETRPRGNRRSGFDRAISERIADHETRLQQTMEQLERVKTQAASVRDALAAEQRNRHTLERQVSELLANERHTDGEKQPVAAEGEHMSRRDMELQLASLSDYVACRKRWWQDMEALALANRQRIQELEQEVAQRLRREAEARQVAENETARAAELHAELVAATREIEQLRRELGELRTARAGPQADGETQREASDAADSET